MQLMPNKVWERCLRRMISGTVKLQAKENISQSKWHSLRETINKQPLTQEQLLVKADVKQFP